MMTRRGGGLNLSESHQCKFTLDKFGIMGFTQRRELDPTRRSKTMQSEGDQYFCWGSKFRWSQHINFWGNTGSRTMVERTCTICTAEGNQVGNTIPEAHKADERGCQLSI